jgi:putative NADH-flavin reductase
MQLFILGGTGRTGQEAVKQALDRGHWVTALVRSPEKLIHHERLTALLGNTTSSKEWIESLRSQDAVLSTLGHNDSGPSSFLHDSAEATVRAMKDVGVRRIVVESMGALFPGFFTNIVRFFLKNHANDSLAMERVIENSGLEWTIGRPPRLTMGKNKKYRTLDGACGASLSRAAVAAFMLDTVEYKTHIGRIVGLAK